MHVWWRAGGRIAAGVMMRLRRWFLAPTASMLAVLFFAPMAIIVAYSFLMRGVYGGVTGEWTIENYSGCSTRFTARSWRERSCCRRWRRSCASCSGFRWRCSSRGPRTRKNLYLQLVMIPFWTSFLVRTYAWMFLLRDTGLINSALIATRRHPRAAAAAV